MIISSISAARAEMTMTATGFRCFGPVLQKRLFMNRQGDINVYKLRRGTGLLIYLSELLH